MKPVKTQSRNRNAIGISVEAERLAAGSRGASTEGESALVIAVRPLLTGLASQATSNLIDNLARYEQIVRLKL